MAHKVAIINGKAPSGGAGGVSDADLSNLLINFFTAGVVGANSYKVEQQTTPNMTVKVNTGKAHVFTAAGTMAYHTDLDTTGSVTISANNAGNPRKDAIVIKIDLGTTPNNYADNVASLVAVQGTPAASPVAPTDSEIQTAVGASNAFYRLADVDVANGATSITNANITDKRTTSGLKAGNKSYFATKDIGSLFSAAQTLYTLPNDLSNPNATEANRQFFVPAGTVYGIYIRISSNTVNGATTVNFRENGASAGPSVSIPASATGNFSSTTQTTTADGDLIRAIASYVLIFTISSGAEVVGVDPPH